MAKVVIDKRDNFTTISNNIFKNTEISFKAKGLLVSMWSCPPTWNFTIEGLAMLSTDGKSSIRSAIKELEEHGYLERVQQKNKNGQFSDLEYILHEEPIPMSKKPLSENPTTEEPISENCTQLNINRLNTDKLNTDVLVNIDSNTINSKSTNKYVLPLKDGQKNIYAFSEKKEQKNSDEDEEEYQTTEEKLKYEIFPVLDDYIEENYEYEYENGMNLVLEDIIIEFHHQYFMKFVKYHRIMKIDTYKKIVDKYFLPPECMEDVYDFKSYKSMIECYFKTNYNKRGNYDGEIKLSLAHFFSENILKNLYHKIQC